MKTESKHRMWLIKKKSNTLYVGNHLMFNNAMSLIIFFLCERFTAQFTMKTLRHAALEFQMATKAAFVFISSSTLIGTFPNFRS